MLLRNPNPQGIRRLLLPALLTLLGIAAIGAGVGWLVTRTKPDSDGEENVADRPPLSADDISIDVPDKVVELADIRTAVATKPTIRPTLRLRGSLMIDVNRLSHVHSRFPGQVKELAVVEETAGTDPTLHPKRRPINFMDRVSEGQLLTVVWSKDLGEKKSEFLAALAQLNIDRQTLSRLEELSRRGGTTEVSVREAQKTVQLDEIAVSKAENTLRSWRLTDQEINEVGGVADRISNPDSVLKMENDPNWARVEVVAPRGGTIVEKNVAQGNMVDATDDLFKVADLSVLAVWAHVYEEDLRFLQELPRPIHWNITINSDPEAGTIPGTVDWISEMVDQNEHMGLAQGLIDNPKGDYKAGQFITATVELPPEENIVEVPTRAWVEDGDESVVLVQTDPARNRFTRRRVFVTRRYYNFVHLRSQLTPDEKSQGFQELHEGERVVAASALELKEALGAKGNAAGTTAPIPHSESKSAP